MQQQQLFSFQEKQTKGGLFLWVVTPSFHHPSYIEFWLQMKQHYQEIQHPIVHSCREINEDELKKSLQSNYFSDFYCFSNSSSDNSDCGNNNNHSNSSSDDSSSNKTSPLFPPPPPQTPN